MFTQKTLVNNTRACSNMHMLYRASAFMINAFRNLGSWNDIINLRVRTDNVISDDSHLFQNSFCAFQSLSAISRVEEIVRQLGENVEILGIHVVSWQVKHPSQQHHHLRYRLVHSHWSRTYISALSLVESFPSDAAPAIICHKEPARASL